MQKRNMALAITATFMSAALLLIIGPQRIAVATTETGDAELSATLRKHTEAGFNNLTAFTLHDGKATFAGLGADEHTEVEIGSVTKMFTAELAHQLVEEGKISLDTTVGEVLDVGQAPISEVTVQELLNHTSGLPRLAQGNIFADAITAVTGANPYAGETTQDILDAATEADLKDRGTESYSNMGYGLLGHLLETAADTSYEELLHERILQPAGMTETYLMTPGSVPDDAPRGLTATGREADPWEMGGSNAAAGALRSTAHDMAAFAEWIMDNGDMAFGWQKREDNQSFWHDGGTGGYSTMLIIDPKNKRAAFANNDTPAWTSDLAQALFDEI